MKLKLIKKKYNVLYGRILFCNSSILAEVKVQIEESFTECSLFLSFSRVYCYSWIGFANGTHLSCLKRK